MIHDEVVDFIFGLFGMGPGISWCPSSGNLVGREDMMTEGRPE
jgi:hypothetical protein